MWNRRNLCALACIALCFTIAQSVASGDDALLPAGVKAVWDLDKAHHETTPTRQRISINGLWRWQPTKEVDNSVPADQWGFCKVPAPWSSNSQFLYPHPAWKGKNPHERRCRLVSARDHCPARLAKAADRRLCRVRQFLRGRVPRRP